MYYQTEREETIISIILQEPFLSACIYNLLNKIGVPILPLIDNTSVSISLSNHADFWPLPFVWGQVYPLVQLLF